MPYLRTIFSIPCGRTLILSGFLGFFVFGLLQSCGSPRIFTDQSQVFELIWDNYAAIYPYFEHKEVDWDEVYSRYQPQFAEPMEEDSFFVCMSRMMAELEDIHIQLSSEKQSFQFSKRNQFAANPPDFVAAYLGPIYYENNRILYADIKGTDIAYLRVQSFAGSVNNYTNFPTETIVSSLPPKEGLIIDLRDNPGGKEDFAVDFASRFLELAHPYKMTRSRLGTSNTAFNPWQTEWISPVDPIKVDYPIILLTNRGSYSATESFVLMMQALPNVQVLGDTTGGASGNPLAQHLPNGWRYTLPTVQVAQLDGQLIEDIGIAPDSVVWMDAASIQAQKDQILESALSIF